MSVHQIAAFQTVVKLVTKKPVPKDPNEEIRKEMMNLFDAESHIQEEVH